MMSKETLVREARAGEGKGAGAPMREPYLSQFRQLLHTGAAMQDIHDSKEAAGYAITFPAVNEAFFRREVERVALHQRGLIPLLEDEVGKAGSVLDAGCSTGGTTVALALSEKLAAVEVIGIDPNRLSLEAAEVRAKGYDLSPDRVRFQPIATDGAIPFEDNRFDLTVCVSVLEFISSAETRRVLAREMQRVTKPGGHIFVSTPTPFRPREYHSRRWLGDYRYKEGYPWSSSPWAIRRMFADCARIPLHRHYQRMARERLGPALGWLPTAVTGRLIAWATPWQKYLFRKNG